MPLKTLEKREVFIQRSLGQVLSTLLYMSLC